MYYIVNGFILALSAISLRAALYPGRKISQCGLYYGLMALALAGTIFAAAGFACLIHSPIEAQGADYSQIVVMLALLAAAVLVGFFGYKPSGKGAVMQTVASASFMALLYFIFGAISYYLGKGANTHQAPEVAGIVSFTLWLILAVNAVRDFADYREAE